MLQITRQHHEAMLNLLKLELPLEGCGLLAGKEGKVQHIYPIRNQLASPIAYEMEPAEQLEAMVDLEDRGWEMLAIYHSHPHGPDIPSNTDVAKAFYPEAIYIIVSLRVQDQPLVRAYSIETGQFIEVSYIIV